MRVLAVGDVVGKPGRRAVRELLPALRDELEVDLVVVNGENAAGGTGLTGKIVEELLSAGADVITTGNHLWAQRDFKKEIENYPQVIIPANLPPGNPGSRLWRRGDVAVFQLMGRLFMNHALDCPFRKADEILEGLDAKFILVDFHAEATSEKQALGRYLDGRASAVWGTHTHVQTSDAWVLPGGTAYITDLGMTGPAGGVIGVRAEDALQAFLTGFKVRNKLAPGPVVLEGAIIELGPDGRARSIRAIRRWLE